MAERSSGELWIPEQKVEFLFGRIADRASVGGAAVRLCGKESGSHRRLALNGEKLAMGRAASQIIVNLWEGANDSDVDEQKVWVYENNDRERHGPYSWKKIETWAKDGLLVHKYNGKTAWDLRLEHVKAGCRLELWLALAMHRVVLQDDSVADGAKGRTSAASDAAEDSGAFKVIEAQLNDARKKLQEEAVDMEIDEDLGLLEAVPMDLVQEKSAHLYIVVDTNILLSYVTFLEQMLELLKTNEMASLISSEGLPGFKLVFVVPYIVMVELDKLKANKKGFEDLASHASAAIRMLENQKTNPKPHYVGETFEDFKLARTQHGDPDLKASNDDRIIFCAKALADRICREGSHADAVVLLSNDTNLCLIARQHHVRAMKPRDVPRTAPDLFRICVPEFKSLPSASGDGNSGAAAGAPPQVGPAPVAGAVVSPFQGATSSGSLDHGWSIEGRSGPGRGERVSQRASSGSINRFPRDEDSGGLDDADTLFQDIERVLTGPVAAMTQYLFQIVMGNVWEDVLSAKVPWTAADVLDVLEHQHRSILDDPSCSFVDERSIAEVVGKGSKLKALVRSLNNRSRLRSALPTAAGPLRSLITSFGELPATAVDPPDDVPYRRTAQDYISARASALSMLDKIGRRMEALAAGGGQGDHLMAGMQGLRINTGRGAAGIGPRGSMHMQPWASGTYPSPHAGYSPGMPPSRSSGPFQSSHAGYDPNLMPTRSYGSYQAPAPVYDPATLSSRPSGPLQLPHGAYDVAALDPVQQAQQRAAAAQLLAYEQQQQQLLLQKSVYAIAATQLAQGAMGMGQYAAAPGAAALAAQQARLHPLASGSSDSAIPSAIPRGMPAADVAGLESQAPTSHLLQDKLAVVHGLLKSEYSTILNLEASADQQMRAERLVQLCTTGSEHLGRAYTAFLESGSDASALLTALQVLHGCLEQLKHIFGGVANLDPLLDTGLLEFRASVERDGASILQMVSIFDATAKELNERVISGGPSRGAPYG